MDIRKLRAWWFEKQGLGGSLQGASAKQVFERAGWARSVGGANPYITMFSRAGIGKEQAEESVAKIEIHELPSARGCTYVMSERDYAMALRMSRGTGEPQDVSTAKKWLGVTDAEIERLESAVLEALEKGPLDPKEIREAVGDAARSLGEEGKKRGQTTTLPLALGLLQSDGHIRRIPTDGRLDQQRYRYTRWDPSPMEGYVRSLEETYIDFARRYFEWLGPATKATFQAISGLGVKAAEAAIAPLNLTPIEDGSVFLVLPDEMEEFTAFQVPREPRYALVSCLDGISHLHWGVTNLIDESDYSRPAFGPKGIVTLGGLSELENHAIYDRGRLIGLWEYDPMAGELVWTSFIEPNEDLLAEVKKMEEFARTLGDVRSFSLDSPESRKPRIDALRASKGH